MERRTRSSSARRRRPWADGAWPVVCGAAGAVGLIGAYETATPVGLGVTYVLLAVIVVATLYCIDADLAPRASTAARWALTAPVLAIAAVGLVSALGAPGSLVVLGVAVTSPPVIERIARGLGRDRRPALAARAHSRSPRHSELDRMLVDQRFVEMVSHLEDAGETSSPGDDT
jgi:hypothetical protein